MIHGSQFTVHSSRFADRGSRFVVHSSCFAVHGFDSGPQHTNVVKNVTSCIQIYWVELGLVNNVT